MLFYDYNLLFYFFIKLIINNVLELTCNSPNKFYLIRNTEMPEFTQTYNFNSLYICFVIIIYNIWKMNYDFIISIVNKLLAFNFNSFAIICNLIGLYLLLKKLHFEIIIKVEIKK